jgi:hypothetical protein
MSHFIIDHPNTSMQPSYNKPLTPGYMNGIQRQTIHKLININSNIREEHAPGWPNCPKKKEEDCKKSKPCDICDKCCYLRKWNSSNFIVRLPEPLDKVVSMKLCAAEIPNTSYVISHTIQTNVFQVVAKNGNLVPVVLPSGNYTTQQLVYLINNILWSLKPCILYTMQTGYDTISGRFYFFIGDAETQPEILEHRGLDFRLPNDSRDIKMNLGWMLGFRKPVYCYENYIEKSKVWSDKSKNAVWPCKREYSPSSKADITMLEAAGGGGGEVNGGGMVWNYQKNPFWPHGFIAEGLLDITGPKYLFLVVNDFNNNVHNKYTSLVRSGLSIPVSNILARISQPFGKNEIGYDDASDLIPKTREYFGPVKIEKLHIQLVDEMGRFVDLNNSDFTLLLEFQCLYNL